MRCRYCGAETSHHQARCSKCQRRLDLPTPVIESAAAPDLADYATIPATPTPRLRAVHTNADAPRREAVPIQPPLFQFRDTSKIVSFQDYSVPAVVQRTQSTPAQRVPRRRVAEGQSAFDFSAPEHPRQPFSREIARRADCPVAPLRLRAMAAAFDTGVVAAMLAVFLITVRLCLGALPTENLFLGCYVAAALLIGMAYKLLWCAFGNVTFGLQGAGLEVVSFDATPPTWSQRFVRLFSGWLSFLAAGMGLLWAVCDQERLSWHDHISQTFLTPLRD